MDAENLHHQDVITNADLLLSLMSAGYVVVMVSQIVNVIVMEVLKIIVGFVIIIHITIVNRIVQAYGEGIVKLMNAEFAEVMEYFAQELVANFL